MNRPLRLAECSHPIPWVGVTLLVNRSQRYRKPSAAVGADLSCPHIRKHIRNGEGKCVFGYGNMHFG